MSSRIVYPIYSGGGLQGGHKMILRHVETLRDLGFDAVAYTGVGNKIPDWFDHRAPFIYGLSLQRERDILAVPDDESDTLRQLSKMAYRVVVFVQNQFNLAAGGLAALDAYPPETFPRFLTVSPTAREMLVRLYPRADIGVVRAFADERIFRAGPERQDAVAFSPRKRRLESQVIRHLFPRLHPAHADLSWRSLDRVREVEVARTFGTSTLCLSLSRLESLGMTPLEAMACGCVVAGFLGVGGRDFATAENGFWVADDDCLAAADALAQAADLVRTGGPALKRRLEAGYETARQWSYAGFRRELEAFWMEVAPKARLKDGPLD